MLSLDAMEAINLHVNAAFTHCPGNWACTADYIPATYGDCKQAAATKLRDLILAGAGPDEFVIWIVHLPSGYHAVVVQRSTGLVLDSLDRQVRPMRVKAQHHMEFEGPLLGPCDECGTSAKWAARIVKAKAWIGGLP